MAAMTMKELNACTARHAARSDGRAGRIGVGANVALLLRPGAIAGTWVLRYRDPTGKRRDMGLGPYPAVSLGQVREAARTALAGLRQGTDPLEARHRQRASAKGATAETPAAVPTFRAVAETVVAAKRAGWRNAKHGKQWLERPQGACLSHTGAHAGRYHWPAGSCAVPHYRCGDAPPETARRVRQRMKPFFAPHARAEVGATAGDPARREALVGHATLTTPEHKRKQHGRRCLGARSGVHGGAGASREGNVGAGTALHHLTAARSGEVRGMRWCRSTCRGEFDHPRRADEGEEVAPGAALRSGIGILPAAGAAITSRTGQLGLSRGCAVASRCRIWRCRRWYAG